EIVNSLKEYLNEKGFNVIPCYAADEAFDLYHRNHPDLVLSDIKMPGKSGLDLFKQCHEKDIHDERKVPFVLMTSYSDIIGAENAFSMGVSELIAKPFDLDSLNLVLNYLLDLDGAIGLDDSYYPVSIDEFINSKNSSFDIYLKVGPRFVLVTRSGQEFSEQRIQNFAKKGVKSIHLNSHDFAQYTDMQFTIANSINRRPIDMVRKTKVMNHLMTSVSRSFMGHVVNEDVFANALTSFEAYAQISLNNSQLNTILNQLLKNSIDTVEKAALRAMLCSMVTTQWKWNSSRFQSRIILSALMCDVGLKDYPELMKKQVFELSSAEKADYEKHPYESYRLLSQISQIPEEITLVALQHHENSAGLGFPQKLMRNKLHSFSVIVHCVNEFIDTLYGQVDKKNVKSALDHLFEAQGKMVNQQVIKTLYILFQLPIPKKLDGLLLPHQTSRLN
ncbi:MAG: response regulator, partial [Bdellovibrionaceae bacterium]|nr:response regulator [Pseudobdellovibrionaceae bacterium]